MAPSSTITALLRQIVCYHLDNNSFDNALFFAEKLAAQDAKSSESTHLLALCHYRLGDFRSAHDVSRASANRGSNLGSIWVFAQSCLKLEKYRDGIVVLEKTKDRWCNRSNLHKHSSTSRSLWPDEANVLCLLGKLNRAYDDHRKAAECFENALKLNPFMFDAFKALCDMGVSLRVPNMFRVTETLVQSFSQEVATASVDPKETATANTLEPIFKKSSARNALDSTEAFDLFRSLSHQDSVFGSSTISSLESEENDFMSKIAASRTRLTQPLPTNGIADGLETPTGAASLDVQMARNTLGLEPPQAPPRRTRVAPVSDNGYADVPSRTGHRAGIRRATRVQDRNQDMQPDIVSEQPAVLSRSSTVGERKRTVSGHPVHMRQQSEEPGPQRRSARLNMVNKPSMTRSHNGAATIGAGPTRELKKARPPISSRTFRPGSSGSNVGRVVSGNRNLRVEDSAMDIDNAEASRTVKEAPVAAHHAPTRPQTSEVEGAKVEEALKWILDLLRKMASGYYALSQFRCQDALQAYSSLPRSQQETAWVLAQMGRCHYEQASYAEAEKYFRRLRVLSPSRMEDMEVYSTILWHLKRETDLSFLAHELVDSAWTSPQAWCTLGNAWSLARDPDQALRCFKRATQLDPKFAYAFTLQGHEHVANEEYEKALLAYRQAIAVDHRHYNAYYGMGKVHQKLGSYDKARTHFHTASTINPSNAVLICCIGTILEKQRNMPAAIQAFGKAVELAPRAAETRYKKARAHLAVGQIQLAQKELLVLKDLAPDEANVHFLLGKMYVRTGEKQLAVRHFTVALALDPKASQQIKDAIEFLEEDDGTEDSIMSMGGGG